MSESQPDFVPRELDQLVTYDPIGGDKREFAVRIRALEEADRVRAARIRANLAGVPWEHLDPEARQLFRCIADVTVAVTNAEELPDWLQPWPLRLLDYPAIAIQLGVLVGGHTERYFRHLAQARGGDARPTSVQIRELAR